MATKVKMQTALAGKNYSFAPGDIATFEDAEAQRHLANGNARTLDEVETAVEEARETATLAMRKKAVTPPAKK
jgi:hypothetical protein